MKEIFVNLKRFDVPRALGGVCSSEQPKAWIESIIEKSIELGMGNLSDMQLVYMLPEALVIPAIEKLESYDESQRSTLHIGVQGVYRDDVAVGGNFGALTTHLPAAAAKNMGCKGVVIGHCEERKDKQNIIGQYEPNWESNEQTRERVLQAVDQLLNQEVKCALNRGMNVLFCIGETATERGEGDLQQVKSNVEKVLRKQLEVGLKDVFKALNGCNVGIAYEPIWAIGPGKVPPNEEYIGFVSSYIKQVVKELYGYDIMVVYGGGLKEENAKMIGSIETIDGGLVALTRFSGEIGFYVEDLRKIIDQYIA